MESDGGMTEIRFVPDDATSLDSMFAAMSECQVTSLYHKLQHLMLCCNNIFLMNDYILILNVNAFLSNFTLTQMTVTARRRKRR